MKKILISAFFILMLWALFVPTFEFPDEQQHFATVALLSDSGRMPRGEVVDLSREIEITEKTLQVYRDKNGNNFYTYQPENKIQYSDNIYGPYEQNILDANTTEDRLTLQKKEAARYPILYYLYEMIFYNLGNQFSVLDRLVFARLGSVLLGVANVWIAYQIGKEVFEKESSSIVLASMVVLQPMMSFVMSGVNSDVLHVTLFSAILLYSLRIISDHQPLDSIIKVSILFALDILTKPQAYIAIPIILAAIILRGVAKKQFLNTVKYLGLMFVLGLVIAAVLQRDSLVRFIKYGAIPYKSQISTPHPNAPEFIEYAKYSLQRLVGQNIVWYWGVFKWLGVVLPSIFWQIANRLVAISALGIIISFFKKNTIEKKAKTLLLILSTVIYILAIFWFDWQQVVGTSRQIAVQARYYFPLLTAHMAIMLGGLMSFGWNKLSKSWIKRLIILFFATMQIAGIYTIAKSYYDISSIWSLFIQASQYKTYVAKGYFWIIWLGAYTVSVINIFKIGISNDE